MTTRARLAATGALLLGALLAASLAVGPVAAADQVIGHPTLDVHVRDDQFAAGQQATLNLYVSNPGQIDLAGPATYEARVTTARATVLTLGSGDTPIVVDSAEYPVGAVPSGTQGPYAFTITVPENVSPGTYHLPVRVQYTYTRIVDYGTASGNPEYSDASVDRVATVTVHVKDRPRFSVAAHRSDVQVGQQGTFGLTLSNTGNQVARDATVTVTSRSDAVTFGAVAAGSTSAQAAGSTGARAGGAASAAAAGGASTETSVGTWRPGATQTVTVPVTVSRDATAGNYSVDVSIAYTDPDGIRHTADPLHTSLTPAPEETFALRNVTSSLRVGNDGTVSGRIFNTGPAIAHDPVVVLPAPGPAFTVDGSEHALPDLAPGASAPVSFSVAVADGADAGAVQLAPTVMYSDGAGNQYESDPLRAGVQVQPHRDVFSLRPTTAAIQPDGDGRLYSIEVTNAGTQPVRNVQATLSFPSGDQSAGASLFGAGAGAPVSVADGTTYLGSLAPGESRTMNVSFNVSANALAKAYPATVTLQYEQPDGTLETTRGYTVPVSVAAATGRRGQIPFSLIVGGSILVAGLVVGAFLWRRRGPS